ncbi:hypothetical protein V6Z96_007442 [Aspergillus fumigatus]
MVTRLPEHDYFQFSDYESCTIWSDQISISFRRNPHSIPTGQISIHHQQVHQHKARVSTSAGLPLPLDMTATLSSPKANPQHISRGKSSPFQSQSTNPYKQKGISKYKLT